MNRLVLIGVAAVALCAVAAVTTTTSTRAADAPPQAMPVSVASVVQMEIVKSSEFTGRLRAVEDVAVRPRVTGVIDAVHFKEGDVVQKGDLLFTIDIRPYKAQYDQAAAALASAQARAGMSSSNYTRAQKLFEQKALSQREFDERSNAEKEAQASVKSAEAQVALAALQVEFAELKAPITGRVGRADVTVGNMVQEGAQVLTTLQSTDPIYADFDIDEQTYLRAMKAVRAGKAQDMPVHMALADESDFAREGKIRSFDNQLRGDSGTMRVRAEFSNADELLTPGLFARVRLGNAEKSQAVLVNDTAISTDQDRKYVYAVDDKGNVGYRPVVLGGISDGLRVIEQGLAAGEKIVVNGLQRVHPGMQVQPMMVDMATLQAPGGAAAGQKDGAAAPEEKK